MANFAKIVIKFTDFTSSQGALLKIKFVGTGTTNLEWSAEILRISAFEYTISAINEVDQAAFAFSAIQADIANHGVLSSKMTVTKSNVDEITIEANEYGWAITDNGTTNDVEATLTATAEVVPPKNFQLIGASLASATDPCSDVKVTITENDGVSPYSWINPANASITLIADLARQASNQTIPITLEDADGDQATINNVLLPRLFTTIEISSVSVVTNQGGFDATVTIFMADLVTFASMTYSLDGSNFQTSNIFTNVVDGTYTIYINDGYGCIITQPLTVDTSTSIQRRNAYAVVPISNSLRLIRKQPSSYKTLQNTLYRDEDYLGEKNPFFAQKYNKTDGIITTQFRSNYDELSARLLDCDDKIISTLTINKKSNNIGSKDKRDCISYNAGNNQTGIYFTAGNIYTPATTDIIGTYELNGNLPEWGEIGNTMVITGQITGTFVIKQVLFDSTVQANVLIIDYAWQSGNQSEAILAEVTYDRLEYDVYEFDIDLNITTGVYYAQIVMTDSLNEYPDLAFDSEYFDIDDLHDRTNFIEYYDSPNTGLDYSTGYKGKIRLESLDPYHAITPGGESTEYNDSLLEMTKLKDVATMEGEMFFHFVPRFMLEKLRLIFMHANVIINGEKWTNTDGLEVENFKNSALSTATIKLRLNNYEEYRSDLIDIDANKGTIDQESGPILQ